MAAQLDLERIAKGLRAERRGRVDSSSGYFGALQLLADVKSRLRVPPGGGRPTDPSWTERRLVPLAPRTLARLDELTARVREQSGVRIEPMQLAALLLERTAERLSEEEAERLVLSGRDVSH